MEELPDPITIIEVDFIHPITNDSYTAKLSVDPYSYRTNIMKPSYEILILNNTSPAAKLLWNIPRQQTKATKHFFKVIDSIKQGVQINSK